MTDLDFPEKGADIKALDGKSGLRLGRRFRMNKRAARNRGSLVNGLQSFNPQIRLLQLDRKPAESPIRVFRADVLGVQDDI